MFCQGCQEHPCSTHSKGYLVSVVLLLAAVSPAGGAAAPAVTAGWAALSAVSPASTGSYIIQKVVT